MSIKNRNMFFFLSLIITLFISRWNDIYSQEPYWETMNVPDKPYWGLTINHMGDVFIGASWFGNDSTGILRSTNNGYTWETINDGLTSFQILCLSTSPDDEVYAGTSEGELFRYNGQSWSKLNVPWNSMQIRSIVFHNEDIIIGLYDSNGRKENNKIYYSNSTTVTWNIVKSDTTAFGIISMQSIPNGKLCVSYAGSANTHLIDYRNSTIEYIGTDKDTLGFSVLTYDSLTNTIYGGSASGVYKYEGNENWELLNNGLSPMWISSLAFNQFGIMFAGTFGYGIYRASNMGVNWSAQLNDGLPTNWLRRLCFDQNGYLYLTTDHGVLRSKNLITGINITYNHYPNSYELYQNYPNPFNPITTIGFTIPKHTKVTMKVYDILGNELKTLLNEEKGIGNYKLEFDGSKLSSGIYFYKMQTFEFSETKKFLLLK